MNREQEIMARAMCYIDDDLIIAAHAPRKKVRRAVPWLAAACLVAVFLFFYPFLRDVIDTGSDLFAPNAGEAPPLEEPLPDGGKPDEEIPYLPNVDYAVGEHTVRVSSCTETTVTFTVTLTGSEPLYVGFKDRMGGMMATTEPDYKDNGVTIRSEVLDLYIDGSTTAAYTLPADGGTYEVTLDYTWVRDSRYVMAENIYFYVYGKKDTVTTLVFPLSIPADTPPAADTAEGES